MRHAVLSMLVGLASVRTTMAQEEHPVQPSEEAAPAQDGADLEPEPTGDASRPSTEPPSRSTEAPPSSPVDQAEQAEGVDTARATSDKPSTTQASDGSASSAAEAAKEANNPLSNLTSLSFQDYKTLDLSQDTDQNRDSGISNVLYVRFAKSIGDRVIVRASLPVVSTYNEQTSGLGDMNIIVPVLLNKMASPLKFGVGPLVNLPTHTDNLGADALGLGLSATAFYMKNPVFQPGALVTWSYNVAPGTPADEGNLLTFQPFLFFQLGHGTYLRSSATATVDFENERYNIPAGLGIGQVLKQDRVVFNAYVEGQQTVWSYGALLPTSQLFFGLNVQVLPKH